MRQFELYGAKLNVW